MTPDQIKTLLEALTSTLQRLSDYDQTKEIDMVYNSEPPRNPSQAVLDAIMSICDHVTLAFGAANTPKP